MKTVELFAILSRNLAQSYMTTGEKIQQYNNMEKISIAIKKQGTSKTVKS